MERLIDNHFALLELADHGCRQVVGRRAEPTAGDNQRATLVGKPAQRRENVGRSIAYDHCALVINAERPKLLGAPWPVAINDATRQHFGAGDDYACTRAHGNREGTAPPTSAAGAEASEFVPIRKSPTIRITTSATTIQVRQPRGLFLAPYESRGS